MIKINFGNYFKKGIEITKLNSKSIDEISNDKGALGTAVLFFAIGGALGSLLSFNPITIIIGGIVFAGLSFVGVGIFHLLARLFKGKGQFMQLYRASGIGSVISWIAAIPFVGFFAMLWNLVITVVIIKNVYKLTTMKAVLVVLIPAILAAIIAAVIAMFFVASIYSIASAGGSLPGLLSIE